MWNLSSLNSSSKVTVCLSLAVLHYIWLWGSFLPRVDGLKTQFLLVAATLGQTPAAPHGCSDTGPLLGSASGCPLWMLLAHLVWNGLAALMKVFTWITLRTAHFPNPDKGVLTQKAYLAKLCVLLISSRESATKIWDWGGARLLQKDKGSSTCPARLPLTSCRNPIL